MNYVKCACGKEFDSIFQAEQHAREKHPEAVKFFTEGLSMLIAATNQKIMESKP